MKTILSTLSGVVVAVAAVGLVLAAVRGIDDVTPHARVQIVKAVDDGDPTDAGEPDKQISYNRDIRPILSDKCFSCHGPDEHGRKADLRLDTPEDSEDSDGAYFAIEPGDPDASEFMVRIISKKRNLVMPPPASKMTLSDEEKRLLAQWIKQGAKYEPHWAFVPPKKPAVPDVDDVEWAQTAIDRFVLRRLEAEGLTPNQDATKPALLRRLTLDLTGLPPTAEELDAFLADKSGHAYEKAVDRLLASKHFGERMAVPWLDAARYADTNGFSIDDHRDMWLWREWVIDAYNRNMPYDQFLTLQLAGDLVPGATDKHRLATGFLRNSMNTHEGGTIPAEYRVIYIADKIDTVSTVFMGLTMKCAQCHDHKYDPLTMGEYYQMYAFFDTAHEPGMGATNANTPPVIRMDGKLTDNAAWRQDMNARLGTLKRYLVHPPELIKPRAAWEASAKASAKEPLADALKAAADKRSDAQWGVINEAFAKTTRLWGRHINTIKREIVILEREIKAGKPSVMVMQEKGPRQTYVLTRGEYDKPDKKRPVDPGVPAVLPSIPKKALNAKPAPKKAVASNPWQGAKWVWDHPKGATAEQDNKPRYFRLVFELKDQPGKATLLATADNACTTYLNGKKLGTNDPWMTPARYDVTRQLVKGKNVIAIQALNAGGVAGLLAALQIDGKPAFSTGKHWKVSQSVKGKWTALGYNDKQWADASELGPASMGPWRIGKGAPAPQQQASSKATRLDLANWLTRPDHPLTARVAVNRTWQLFFGKGLVTTPNDLGMQGAYPTHPDLLDYLAVSYVESGWDTKALIKSIVMSATYRQSSHAPRELYQRDPGNALLARASRFRLPAEFIRDSALAISGQLDTRVGGPSVYPSQPHGLWREVSHFGYPRAFTAQAFYPSQGDDLTRRSMYTFWKRTSPPPSLSVFDAPSREVCTVDRPTTNTPLQALVLLNDPEYVGAARELAKLTLKEGNEQALKSEHMIHYMFRRATGHTPDDKQVAVLMRHKGAAMTRYRDDPDAAKAIAGDGGPSLAAWTSVASVILNLDQTITRE